ncbi:MAG: glycosyltransferase family 2 protein [Patescibacteria group bacterium]
MKILVLIPAKDEKAKIFSVVREIKDCGFEVLVIDDGSSDNTGELAKAAGAKVLRHVINRGQGAALRTGLSYALKGDYQAVVFFDADGQMLASEIEKLLEPLLLKRAEVVLGSRFLGRAENISFSKLITLKLALLFTKLTTGLKLTDVHNGFQAWDLSALEKITLTQDRYAYASEILKEIAHKRLRYQEVPVTIKYTDYSKKKGQSIFNALHILWDLMIKK